MERFKISSVWFYAHLFFIITSRRWFPTETIQHSLECLQLQKVFKEDYEIFPSKQVYQ